MNLKKEMAIIDDSIVTNDISYCNLIEASNLYRVKHIFRLIYYISNMH